MPVPKHIELVVNGTKEQVQAELTKRNFHPSLVYQITQKGNQCEVLVSTACEPSVEKWFKELPPVSSAGCLVYYSI